MIWKNEDSSKNLPIPAAHDNEYREVGWGIKEFGTMKFEPMWINRPKVGDHDIRFEMKWAGVCHSDVHCGLNHLGGSIYPMVPGHELMGTVLEVGSKVTKVKVGDNVGVGVMKDTCLDCPSCKSGEENYCATGFVHTYNSDKKYTHIGGNPALQNFGGYTGSEVIHEHFAFKIPDGLDISKAAPILCAGITLFDPLRHWGATTKQGMTIGIVGIGGLGTMGIKLAKAMGHKVVAISTTKAKEQMAKEKGADVFVASKDEESLKANANTCDLILNTVSAAHQVSTYIPLLRTSGTIVQLGLVDEPHQVNQMMLLPQRKSISASCIGGIPSHEELLEFCAKHQIYPDVQHILAKDLDKTWETLNASNVDGVRYVIDIKKSLADDSFLPPKE